MQRLRPNLTSNDICVMRLRALSGPPRRNVCSHNFCGRPATLRLHPKVMMRTGEPRTAHSTSANATARAIFETNKNVGPRDAQELHPRFRDALPTPLRDGGRLDLKEISSLTGPAQSIDDLARVCGAQVVFHGEI